MNNMRVGGIGRPFNPLGYLVTGQELLQDSVWNQDSVKVLASWYRFKLRQGNQPFYYDSYNRNLYRVGDSIKFCVKK